MKQKRTLHKVALPRILADPEARVAWEKLTTSGASPKKLKQLLQLAVYAESMTGTYDMLSVEGLTRDQVSHFPDRLRQIATSIDFFRENPHLCEENERDSEIRNLPSALRGYADHLESTIRHARAFMKENPRYWDFPSIWKLNLLNYVRTSTGSSRYAVLARLLNGTFTTAGLDKVVEPNSLQKLEKRHLRANSARCKKLDPTLEPDRGRARSSIIEG